MSAPTPPLAMVVLASRQLWPNIQGIVHWHQFCEAEGPIQDLCIYHTDNESESRGPARRLKRFCAEEYPKEKRPGINVHQAEGGILPDDVSGQIRSWKRELGERRWIINAAGGLKLMFSGALQLVGEDRTRVVYRERKEGWYELVPENDQVCLHNLEDIQDTEPDSVSIKSLLKALLELEALRDLKIDNPEQQDLLSLTKALVEKPGDWRRAFKCNDNSSHGALFEKYVAAAVLELGIPPENVALNFEVKTEQGKALLESDVVVNHKSRLWILDCKLRTEEEENQGKVEGITTQIEQASSRRRGLGGLDAKLIMLRPNRKFEPEHKAMAEALGVKVIDQEDSVCFFTHLKNWFDPKSELPKSLTNAEKTLCKAQSDCISTVLGCEDPRVRRSAEGSGNRAILSFEGIRKVYQDELGQNWIAWWDEKKSTIAHLEAKNTLGLSKAEVEKRITTLVGTNAQVKDCSLSNEETTCFATLQVEKGGRKKLEGCLKRHCGKSLWQEHTSSEK